MQTLEGVGPMTSMMRRFALVVSLVVALSSSNAQDDTQRGHPRFELFRNRIPALSVLYGFTANSLRGFNQSLAGPRYLELKAGGMKLESGWESPSVAKYRYEYITISNISNKLGNTSPSGEVTTDTWRLGFAWERGYGYEMDDTDVGRLIVLYSSEGINWSRVNFTVAPLLPADSALASLYDDVFRFGTKMEAGLKVKLVPLVVLDAGFERGIVFPRHLFVKWLGSTILEGIAQSLIDRFVGRIMESSPAAAPIVAFVLKNGFAYSVYQLRREKMNYPFESDAPLLNNTFKFGLTLTF